MGKRREYTIEFKLEAIKLVRETGQPSAKIARDLGMSGDLLSRWVRKYNEKMSGVDAFPGKGKLAPYDKERFDLKKELARITRERDILKKALGYFAGQKE
ncbi:MAG: transposase [Wolbachia endosymbiont of Homalodisca vitripennis]|nr:transposase [Wolbachia endosymbiont of Homalodisca vitripennis]MBR9983214.1 transposase [Wolbachia endosymbiont of Homalodisca vitripennis]MBR9983360.1 transposase [Wolbachia endosymbiont of Homalodisca vitripennis]MBR9983386.1 transposase [Wolbachia endosymbiont of Homalodisca vitripennis]MBR9983519.1 transposase [Wolbachia endosymbiont of Homalodisca vitripennis]